MRRLLLAALVVAVLLPAGADAGSDPRARGLVTAKDQTAGLVTVATQRRAHVLRVPGSLERIRLGQRVELRGTTLRRKGNGSRVLARGVLVVRVDVVSRAGRQDDEPDDDEREVRGRITSLSPLTVAGLTCTVPSGVSLAGLQVGDVAEMTCDLIRGTWTLRKIHLEDDDEVRNEDDNRRNRGGDDDGDRGGRNGDDDDDGGHSGHGGGATTTRPPAAAAAAGNPTGDEPSPEPRRPPEEAVGARTRALFERHGRMVLGLCRVLLRDPFEAEDAAQQTFVNAHRALVGGARVATTRPGWRRSPGTNAALGSLLGCGSHSRSPTTTSSRSRVRPRLRSRQSCPTIFGAHSPSCRSASARRSCSATCTACATGRSELRSACREPPSSRCSSARGAGSASGCAR